MTVFYPKIRQSKKTILYIPAKINNYADLNYVEFVENLCSDTSCENNELLANPIIHYAKRRKLYGK